MPMRRARRNTRALQLGFLALLVFSTAQDLWWIYDQERLATREHDRLQALYEDQREAARLLLAKGSTWPEVTAHLPQLELIDGQPVVSPAALAALDHERASWLRRYGWEGSFFLSVLIACMAVIWRTLAEEKLLRRRQENFIAAVTHEFKSPLASLQLSVETIGLRQPGPERLRELTERMRGDISRLEMMVGQILDTASLEAGQLRLTKEPVALARAVEGVAGELRERADAAKVSIVAEVGPELIADADPVATVTVLRNLLENALRATAAAGGGRIDLVGTLRDGHVHLRVSDTGVGFPPAEAANLFEKFYRPGDELRRTGRGSGLGLYLVHRLMQLEHGEVAAESGGPGQGATFTVAWPRHRSEDER